MSNTAISKQALEDWKEYTAKKTEKKVGSRTYTLLVASREGITPLTLTIPTTFALHNVIQLNDLKDLLKILVRIAIGLHVLYSVRVDDLVAEGSKGQIRALRNIEDVLGMRAMDSATYETCIKSQVSKTIWLLVMRHLDPVRQHFTIDGPKATENAEQTALATTVGTDDQQMHAWLDVEAQLLEQNISVGRDNRDIHELDCVILYNLATTRKNLCIFLG